jgi:O-antigen/teichoic acid export membrane protein
MSERTSQGIGTRTIRGVAWAYGSWVGGRFTSLVATAILARLLAPHDFGLVALALIFMTLLDMLSDLGVSQALVVSGKEEELERAETVFVWNIGFGVALSILTAALGPVAAVFFDQHALVFMLPVLGLRFFLRSIGATHYALAQKWIQFRPRTISELSETVTRGVIAIVLALTGFGAWSLVIGYVVGTAASSIVSWIVVPWRPKLQPSRADLRDLLAFGGKLTGVDILAAIQGQTDYIFIGRVLGATDLGIYTLGYRIPSLLIGNLTVVVGRVLFPAFAAVERARLSDAFQRSLRYTLMFVLPMTAALVILADPLTIGVFGDKWERSVEPMQVLALYSGAIAIGIPAGTVYKSIGRAGILLALGVPRTILLIAAVGLFVHEGIVAVAAAMTGVTCLFAVIGMALATRLLGIGLRGLWSASWSALLATAGMSAVLVVIERGISQPILALAVGAAAGTIVYLLLLWLFARDELVRLRNTAFPRRAAVPQKPVSAHPETVS